MLVRVLLVVLTILNLGVAMWWATQPPSPPAPPMPAMPAGVATLQLVEAPALAAAPLAAPASPTAMPADADVQDTAGTAEAAESAPAPADPATVPTAAASASAPPATTPAPAPVQTAPAATPAATPTAESAVCLSVGPYPDRAAAQAAVAAIGVGVPRPRLREVADGDAAPYRVMLPTIGGEDGLRLATERIVAAGIRDYYPLRGEAGNAIALGQYRSREGAERRLAELARAGFNADLIPSGGPSRWWLDLRADSAAQAIALRRQLGAARQRPLDCATLR